MFLDAMRVESYRWRMPKRKKHNIRTPGQSMLVSVLTPRWTERSLAEALGCRQQSVHAWVSGASKPDPEKRDLLAVLLGIPVESWG